MKLKNIEFKSSLAEIMPEDHYHHPGLRIARFVFCDDKPNQNGVGVEYEDFAEIIKTSIGTPVKMKFLGQTVSGHLGSVPIGHITNMFENELGDGTHQLIADASLYADDYPDEIDYLEQSFAESKAPGISFEMSYKNDVLKEGVKWLKGLVTRAATFVRDPAYGNRTALLALASNNKMDAETFMKELTALIEMKPITKDEGGNNVTEEEAKKLQDALVEAKERIQELEAEKTTLETTSAELSAKLDVANESLSTYAEKELVSKRTQAVMDAGITVDPAKLEQKQNFWVHLSDEAFAEYVEDLKIATAAATKTATAERKTVGLPRFSGKGDGVEATGDIRSRIASLRNTPLQAE